MTYPSSVLTLRQTRYKRAMRMFDDGKLKDCIAQSTKNLNDPGLSPYYIMKNSILLASALDDWDKADYWVSVAERSYRTALNEAKRTNDAEGLEVLEAFRKQLDELAEFKIEDLAGGTKEKKDGVYDGRGYIDILHAEDGNEMFAGREPALAVNGTIEHAEQELAGVRKFRRLGRLHSDPPGILASKLDFEDLPVDSPTRRKR